MSWEKERGRGDGHVLVYCWYKCVMCILSCGLICARIVNTVAVERDEERERYKVMATCLCLSHSVLVQIYNVHAIMSYICANKLNIGSVFSECIFIERERGRERAYDEVAWWRSMLDHPSLIGWVCMSWQCMCMRHPKCTHRRKRERERESRKHTHKHYKVSLAGWHNEGRMLLKEKLFPLHPQTLSEKSSLP